MTFALGFVAGCAAVLTPAAALVAWLIWHAGKVDEAGRFQTAPDDALRGHLDRAPGAAVVPFHGPGE